MKEIQIEVNGQKLWLDWDRFVAEQEWIKKKEKEYGIIASLGKGL